MGPSLRWQILWAPALALAVAGSLLSAEVAGRARLSRRIAEASAMRESLEHALARLESRHQRTVRRANEAVLEPRPAAREAILAWTSEHYVTEMERYGTDTRAAIAAVKVSGADERLPADLARLQTQVGRIVDQAHTLAPVLDSMLSAVQAEDPDATLAATQDLERADRVMQALTQTADAMVRRAAVWQIGQALAAPDPVPRWGWVLLGAWAVLSLVIAQRPVARLHRLARGGGATLDSPEEAALASRLRDLETERDSAAGQLTERTRAAERAEAAARRGEQEIGLLRLYNENLVNSLRTAVVVTDVGMRVQSFNRTARLLLALDDRALGASLEDLTLFGALGRQAHDTRAELARALAERATLRFESVPYPAPAGERLLDLVIAPYMDESGAARGLLFVADDVTEAVHTKNQLLAAERLAAVGRLSAQVAHEIRNPLSAIGLNAELLGDDFAQELGEPRRSEATRLLAAISAEVERLTEVTEGYLQLTRLPRPSARRIDVNQLVGDLASMLREEHRTHGVVTELDLASPAPLAWIDPGQIRQALLNVLRNSREAMPAGGRIRVATRSTPDGVEIEVDDSGPGIPSEVLPRIFEPFFSTKQDGTGLGLSLTREIVAEHGGTIHAEASPGGGARIVFALPSSAAPPEAGEPMATAGIAGEPQDLLGR